MNERMNERGLGLLFVLDGGNGRDGLCDTGVAERFGGRFGGGESLD